MSPNGPTSSFDFEGPARRRGWRARGRSGPCAGDCGLSPRPPRSGRRFLADDVAAFTPDVMIVDMALPDRDTLEGLRQSSGRAPRPAVLFADDPALAAEAIAAGVHAYHFDETGAQEIKPILIAAIALFRHRPKSADPE